MKLEKQVWSEANAYGKELFVDQSLSRIAELEAEVAKAKEALHDAEAIGDFSAELRDRLALKEAAQCVPILQAEVDELKAELAKAMAMLRLVGAKTDKNMFDKIEANNAHLRECLKRIEEIVQNKIIYLWAVEIAKIAREGLK
jgi:hypothetical protein